MQEAQFLPFPQYPLLDPHLAFFHTVRTSLVIHMSIIESAKVRTLQKSGRGDCGLSDICNTTVLYSTESN
jgi:hypothetical protein